MLVQNLMNQINVLRQKYTEAQLDSPLLDINIFSPDKSLLNDIFQPTTETCKNLNWNKSAIKLEFNSELLNQHIEMQKSKLDFGEDFKQTNDEVKKICLLIPEFSRYQYELDSSESKNLN